MALLQVKPATLAFQSNVGRLYNVHPPSNLRTNVRTALRRPDCSLRRQGNAEMPANRSGRLAVSWRLVHNQVRITAIPSARAPRRRRQGRRVGHPRSYA
jgi:hypothetical protein